MRLPGIPATSTAGSIGAQQGYDLARQRQKLAKQQMDRSLAMDIANSMIGAAGTGFDIYGGFANRDLQRELQNAAQAHSARLQQTGIGADVAAQERGFEFERTEAFPHQREMAKIQQEGTLNIQGNLLEPILEAFKTKPTPETRTAAKRGLVANGFSPEEADEWLSNVAVPSEQMPAYLTKVLQRPEFSRFAEVQGKGEELPQWGGIAQEDPLLYSRLVKEMTGQPGMPEDVKKAMALMLLRDQLQGAGMKGPQDLLSRPEFAPEPIPKVQFKPNLDQWDVGKYGGLGPAEYPAPLTKEQILEYKNRNQEREALKAVLQQLMQQYMGP